MSNETQTNGAQHERYKICLELSDPAQARLAELFQALGKDRNARKAFACTALMIGRQFYENLKKPHQGSAPP